MIFLKDVHVKKEYYQHFKRKSVSKTRFVHHNTTRYVRAVEAEVRPQKFAIKTTATATTTNTHPHPQSNYTT